MKCGTTWMQHIVYEVVGRGRGDLVATGTTLYSQSCWLEAPLGDGRHRCIGHHDVSAETRQRIGAWAVREIGPSTFPLARAYPDLQ